MQGGDLASDFRWTAQQSSIGVVPTGGVIGVPVNDTEVHIRASDREHGMVPVHRISVIGINDPIGPVTGSRQHHAHLDGRVNGFHGLDQLHGILGVGGGSLLGMGVVLPVGGIAAVAVDLVANLPILDAVGVADTAAARVGRYRAVIAGTAFVGVLYPASGFLRRARAIVDRNDRLRTGSKRSRSLRSTMALA